MVQARAPGCLMGKLRPEGVRPRDVSGRYVLDDVEAVVDETADGLFVQESETDPVTGTRVVQPRVRARELAGGGVFGYAGGPLMSHRLDFPRPGFGRIGWVAMPRVEPEP